MKGLLVKDFCLLKNQKNFFIIVMIFAVIASTTLNPSSIVVYSCVVISMFTASTLTYDEYDNGYAFLFTLPISRKCYVLEKYMYSLILTMLTTVFCFIFLGIYQWMNQPIFHILSWTIECGAIIVAMCILNSITLPLYLKFGGEKGRIVLMAMTMFIVGGVILVSTLFPNLNFNFVFSFSLNITFIIMIILLITGVIVLLSYMISLRIIHKKEF